MKAKLFFILVLLCLLSTKLWANDTIITKNAERLIVKITEVSSQEIKYKELDNLDGPIFVLNAAEINTIIFSNGSIKTFNQISQSPSSSPSNNNNYYCAIKHKNNSFIVNGEAMNRVQFGKFLYETDVEAYNVLNQGDKLLRTGTGLLVFGLTFDLVGFLMGNISNNRGASIAGYTIAGIGGALEIACIPTLCIGSSKISQSVDVYNRNNSYKKQTYALTLNPCVSRDGFGLVLKF